MLVKEDGAKMMKQLMTNPRRATNTQIIDYQIITKDSQPIIINIPKTLILKAM